MAMIYDQSLVGKKQSVVDEVLLLNPHQTPLINLLGFSEAVTNTTYEWYEDEMFAYETTVTADKQATDTVLPVASIEPFRVGHVVKVGEELMKVTNVDSANNQITVQRGYADTTAAAISNGAKIEVLFVEGAEGADAREARYKPRVRKYNKTQIFDDTIQVTGTAQAVRQHGIDDLYEYERQKKLLELALQLEKALINGIEFDNGIVRQMRGMRSFIETNVIDAVGQPLSLNMINDLAQKIYEKGGFATGGRYVVMVPAKQKRALSDLRSENLYITQQENVRGQVVDMIVTDFGQFEVVLNNNLKADELFLIDTNRAFIRPLVDREFFHKYLGDKGDYVEGMLVGEYTLEFREEKAHGRIKGLA